MKLFFDNTPDKKKKENVGEKMEGMIERVIYHSEENSYSVCELELSDGNFVTIEGYMPMPEEGDRVLVWGKWVVNPRFGKQFKVEQYERLTPKDTEDIIRYLAGGAIKGIGPVSAAKIVAKFGESTFDVLENHPEWLADIPGISRKKAKAIGEDYISKASMRDTLMFFREYFGMTLIMKIYKRWGKDSVRVVKENPYCLCDEIEGIGFEKADNLAVSIGVDPSSGERIRAGILYALDRQLNGNGHMCLPFDKLISDTAKSLQVDGTAVLANIGILLANGHIMTYETDGQKYVYLREAYKVEKNLAKRLLFLNRARPTSLSAGEIEGLIEKQEWTSGITYASKQKRAIYECMQHGLMIMTGGPGTGKTTVVRALLNIFESLGYKIALCAPTGRAAMRLSEATSHSAKTIHRLLEMDFQDGADRGFLRNVQNPLEEDVVIVDEVSMVDCMLMNSLLCALKHGSRIVLIGDADQLPSVGGGNVLSDLISSGLFPVVALDEIFRQAKESLIVTNAHAINNGDMPTLDCKSSDFFFIEAEDERTVAATVCDLCKTRLPKAYSVSPFSDIQVLSPMKKGVCGTDNLNSILQEALNPKGLNVTSEDEYVYNSTTFRVGDKVMQMKNNYDITWTDVTDYEDGSGIFNGDVGTIEEICESDGYMTILFDRRRTDYDLSLLDDLALAYAVTVHKSQGSEYPFVVMPMTFSAPMLMTRNLLYTAVTRAKRMVILVGSRRAVLQMVENNSYACRYTCLKPMLTEAS